MKILFVTSECAPYSKSGGLADVAFSLPPALKREGQEIQIITPYYKCARDRFSDQISFVTSLNVTLGQASLYCGLLKGELNGVPVWFIDNQDLFNRDKLYGYDDDKFRFAWFSKAVIEVMRVIDFIPDILHCNDWESALAIIYLRDHQTIYTEYRNIRTVYTIHNIAYQGQYGADQLTTTFALDPGWYAGGLGYEYEGRSDVNLMKGAMLMSDAVSTVSPTYARELHQPRFGKGLQGVCDMIEDKMYGIINGIDPDHYDPAKDKRLPANFTVADMSGKLTCKHYLQDTFGLRREVHWPLFAVVARLVPQKGVDLIMELLPQLMQKGIQLIIFGQGERKYTDFFRECTYRYPGQLGFSDDYSEEMAARVFAGADLYLMPSEFEPCGLSQMMAMRYGTVPVVHETGGLKDTVRPYSDFDGIGDGFSFSEYNAKSLMLAIDEAIKLYFAERKTFKKLRERCMKKDFSWDKSAQTYIKMYSDIASSQHDPNVTFKDAYDALKVVYEDLELVRNKYLARQADDFSVIAQVRIVGPGEGTFYLKIDKSGLEMQPYNYEGADVSIATSLDNLFNMATGAVSADKLFVNGQMKVEGNISKGAKLRNLLGKPEE